MNAAISASVVLASRLATDIDVFALILFSVQTFALFPILRHRMQVACYMLQFFALADDTLGVVPNPRANLNYIWLGSYGIRTCCATVIYRHVYLIDYALFHHLSGARVSCLGPTIQKVWSSLSFHLAVLIVSSEIRGPWDVATPKVN